MLQIFTEDCRFTSRVTHPPDEHLAYLETNFPLICGYAKRSGHLPSYLSLKKCYEVSGKLLQAAYTVPPSAQAIRSISKDVETVWKIGTVMGGGPQFQAWVTTAAAEAGSEPALLYIAALSVQKSFVPPSNPVFKRLEYLAIEKKFPSAIILQAKVLGLRGQFAEGVALIEKVMEDIYPTRLPPSPADDILLGGQIPPPWEVYAWLRESLGDHSATDEIVKVAALNYQDPQALIRYAQIRKLAGDLEMYEECMSRAARAGNVEACRKLANFYYLTFHGRFPRRGERIQEKPVQEETQANPNAEDTGKTKKTKRKEVRQQQPKRPASAAPPENATKKNLPTIYNNLRDRVLHLLGRCHPPEHYSMLAYNWYQLAAFNHCPKAAFVYAILCREREDNLVEGFELLQVAFQEDSLRAKAKELMDKWEDESYEPKIPVKLLDT